MSTENASLDELWRAKDLVDEYRNWHPFKTWRWHSIVIGEVERLKEVPWEEYEEVPGIIVGMRFGSEVRANTRFEIDIKLGAAGLHHIPVVFIESTQLNPS